MKRLELISPEPNIDIRRYIGIPFKWGGDSPASGLDCYNFVSYIHKDITGVGIKIFKHLYENCNQHNQGLRRLESGLIEVAGQPKFTGHHLDLCLIGRPNQEALAIILQHNQMLYLAYQTVKQKSKVIPLKNVSVIRKGFWDMNNENVLEIPSWLDKFERLKEKYV